ncbi:MAG: hypothetical protein K6T63_09390 [Alicyclobacillus herbarius]|uniref:hypothetical protein n=1 Tax=Alicyclobacillus herbarius TaxID=122960 RepID=UPI002353ADC1|nr:hypothetical protein [Alicyclobacillus herbarius]MCL6632835.1 hypothetical protein [Alicyclobacillus herbarius]
MKKITSVRFRLPSVGRFGRIASVRMRLLVSFLVLLIVPALVIGWFSFQAADRHVKSEVNSSAISNVTLFDQSLTTFFTQQEENITFLANNADAIFISGIKTN